MAKTSFNPDENFPFEQRDSNFPDYTWEIEKIIPRGGTGDLGLSKSEIKEYQIKMKYVRENPDSLRKIAIKYLDDSRINFLIRLDHITSGYSHFETIALNPTNRHIATNYGNNIIVYDLESEKIIAYFYFNELEDFKIEVTTIKYSTDGLYIAIGDNWGNISIIDLQLFLVKKIGLDLNEEIESIEFFNNNKDIVFLTSNNKLGLLNWNEKDINKSNVIIVSDAVSISVNNNNNTLAIATKRNIIEIWDSTNRKKVTELKNKITNKLLLQAEFSPNGEYLAYSSVNCELIILLLVNENYKEYAHLKTSQIAFSNYENEKVNVMTLLSNNKDDDSFIEYFIFTPDSNFIVADLSYNIGEDSDYKFTNAFNLLSKQDRIIFNRNGYSDEDYSQLINISFDLKYLLIKFREKDEDETKRGYRMVYFENDRKEKYSGFESNKNRPLINFLEEFADQKQKDEVLKVRRTIIEKKSEISNKNDLSNNFKIFIEQKNEGIFAEGSLRAFAKEDGKIITKFVKDIVVSKEVAETLEQTKAALKKGTKTSMKIVKYSAISVVAIFIIIFIVFLSISYSSKNDYQKALSSISGGNFQQAKLYADKFYNSSNSFKLKLSEEEKNNLELITDIANTMQKFDEFKKQYSYPPQPILSGNREVINSEETKLLNNQNAFADIPINRILKRNSADINIRKILSPFIKYSDSLVMSFADYITNDSLLLAIKTNKISSNEVDYKWYNQNITGVVNAIHDKEQNEKRINELNLKLKEFLKAIEDNIKNRIVQPSTVKQESKPKEHTDGEN